MTDTAIRNALRRREELVRRIKECEAQIASARSALNDVEAFISAWFEFADEPAKIAIQSELGEVNIRPEPATKYVNPPRSKVGDAVERILRYEGRPLPRRPLFLKLREAGVEIQGKDPEMVFSTMMWRMQDRFVRLKEHGYWLKDEPCPEIGYPDLFADGSEAA